MPPLPEHYQNELRSRGLVLSKPFVEDHVLPAAVFVGKPDTVAGNSIPSHKCLFHEHNLDAPVLYVYFQHGKWHVALMEVSGGGRGDFHDQWDTPEEVVADVIDFFFGDPKRMQAKLYTPEPEEHTRVSE